MAPVANQPTGEFYKLLTQAHASSAKRQSTNADIMSELQSSAGSGLSSQSIGTAASGLPVGGTGAGNSSIVNTARKYIGVPYVAGGRTPKSGMDCSGYTAYVLKEALGITVPALSGKQAQGGAAVNSLKDAQPGDLLFFDLGPRDTYRGIDHVAIYLGNGRMLEAPRPGKSIGEVNVYAQPVSIRRYG